MATKAERFHSLEERSGAKKAKRVEKRERPGRPGRDDLPRVLESSRTRGQDIRVTRPPRRSAP
jgi:hypothetical protein